MRPESSFYVLLVLYRSVYGKLVSSKRNVWFCRLHQSSAAYVHVQPVEKLVRRAAAVERHTKPHLYRPRLRQ